jgi:hypothetical protein
MKVDFFKGEIVRDKTGPKTAYWAKTPHNVVAQIGDEIELLEDLNQTKIISEELITSLPLSGLDRAGVETLVINILRGGYLAKPGVKDKGEAVLFILANEAIHELESIQADENTE